MYNNNEKIDDAKVLDMLSYISVSNLDYQEWLNVGMALKDNGTPFYVWDNWSQNDDRYKPYEMLNKWNSFNDSGVSIGTVVKMAQDNGWKPANSVSVYDWNTIVITDAEPPIEFSTEHNDNNIPTPVSYNPTDDMTTYLRIMFKSGDIVNIVPKSTYDEVKDKYNPTGNGISMERDKILDGLIKYNGDFGAVVGDYDPNAGCWIRVNPLDGQGIRNKNVSAFRHCVLESDDMPVGAQLEFYKKYPLPIECVVLSGNKSAHALVKIDAENEKEYNEKVGRLYAWCNDKGFSVDPNNKNSARLTRLPGCKRGDTYQRIILGNIGCNTFNEWEQSLEIEGFPIVKSWADIIDSNIEVKPEVIQGVLRQGHKMLICSGSKAGKTFCLLQLAFALGHGYKWLNFQCKKSKVLYINLEVDEPSFMQRFKSVNNALMQRDGLDDNYIHSDCENMQFLTLRGYNKPLSEMKNNLIRRAVSSKAEVIIIDPIYKITEGDENSAGDMGKFCNMLDEIAQRTNCSLVYAHHFAKGSAGNKAAIDRMSGSGVFGRDPDAILSLTNVDVSDELATSLDDFRINGNKSTPNVYRVEGELREFCSFDSFDIVFSAPLHTVDKERVFAGCKLETEIYGEKFSDRQKRKQKKREENLLLMISVYDSIVDSQNGEKTVKKTDLASGCNISQRQLCTWLSEQSAKEVFEDSVIKGCVRKITKN